MQWTLLELFDIAVMVFAVGFIFHDVFRVQLKNPVERLLQAKRGFQWHDFWFACSVVGPAILLHEIGHKVMAVSFGLDATFHAAYFWLLLGIALKLFNFPFIFFVPAFVSISGAATPLQDALISFAGPGVNGILWLGSWLVLRNWKTIHLSPRGRYYFALSKQINMFLFIFNLIPIPGFDGFSFFSSLIKVFTG